MIHIGRGSRSTIISKGISAGQGQNTYRGCVKVAPTAAGARNFTQCDSLLIGSHCGAHTFPRMDVMHPNAQIEHEASTTRIDEEKLRYCRARGLDEAQAVSMIVNGFCKPIFQVLPMEFAVEARQLMEVSLEGCVG